MCRHRRGRGVVAVMIGLVGLVGGFSLLLTKFAFHGVPYHVVKSCGSRDR